MKKINARKKITKFLILITALLSVIFVFNIYNNNREMFTIEREIDSRREKESRSDAYGTLFKYSGLERYGGGFKRVDEKEFTFSAKFTDINALDSITPDILLTDKSYFENLSFTYEINDKLETSYYEGSSHSTSDSYWTVGNEVIETGESYQAEITIHNDKLLPGVKVDNIDMNENGAGIFSWSSTASGFEIQPEFVITDNTMNVIEIEYSSTSFGATGNNSSIGFYMPDLLYVKDSLIFGELTDSTISFSYTLNGTEEKQPFVTYEFDYGSYNDDTPEIRQRVMGVKDSPKVTDNGDNTYTYTYTIDSQKDIENPNSTTSLDPNMQYENIRVYLNPITLDSDNEAFVDPSIDTSKMMLGAPVTLTTLGIEPTVGGMEVETVGQTTASFSIAYNASGVIKTDASVVELDDWVEYAKLEEAKIEVGYIDSNSSLNSKADLELITADSWTTNPAAKQIVGKYSVTGLNPETEYKVYVDPDNTTGLGIVDMEDEGTIQTTDYDPHYFSGINLLDEGYRDATVQLAINTESGSIYDEFDPRNVRAYSNVPTHSDGDTSVFVENNRLDISFVEQDAIDPTLYTYKINDLNSDNHEDGEEINNIRFVYSEQGELQGDEVSNTLNISTLPLLDPIIITTTDAFGDEIAIVDQVGGDFTKVNIKLPELYSGEYYNGVSTPGQEAYKNIKYGKDGNLLFAALDPAPVGPIKNDSEKAVAPTEDQYLSADEVTKTSATTFEIDLASRTSLLVDESESRFEFDLAIGTKDPSDPSGWVWAKGDTTLSTKPLNRPELISITLADTPNIGQNSVDVSVQIRHAGDGIDTEYSDFVKEKDIAFKGWTVDEAGNPLEEDITFDDTTVVEETTVAEGKNKISTYTYSLEGLRAETRYTFISYSIGGSEYVPKPIDFTTLNRNMVGFNVSSAQIKGDPTYDSLEFTIDATTGGNYKTLTINDESTPIDDDDINDIGIKINYTKSNFSSLLDPTEYEYEVKDFTIDLSNKGTDAYYSHIDKETTNNYTINLDLSDILDNDTKNISINSIVIFDKNTENPVYDSPVDGVKEYVIDTKTIGGFVTNDRLPAQFTDDSSINIISESGSEETFNSFDFQFKIRSGGEYTIFNPETDVNERLTLQMKPIFTDVPTTAEIDNVEVVSYINNEYTIKATASGLAPGTTYRDITLSFDDASNFDGFLDMQFVIKYNGLFTTADLRSPILPETFSYNSIDVTNTTMKFKISAIGGSENDDIKNEGYDKFEPKNAQLGYRDENLAVQYFETEYLEKESVSYDENGEARLNKTYEFFVSDLDPDTQYSNLLFKYNTGNRSVVEIEGASFTTKQFKSPFDPLENPVEFDSSSITSDSIEFEINVLDTNTVENKNDYSSFSMNETVVFANSRQLSTRLIAYEGSDEDTGVVPSDRNADGLITYRYVVENLDDATTYEDFAVVINAYGGSRAGEDTIPEINTRMKGSEVYYTQVYEVPYFTIRTLVDISTIVISISIMGLVILLLLIIFIIYFVHRWWVKHISLSVYDDTESFSVGMPIYRLINGKKHHKFWNSYVDNMRLYASGKEIESTFIRVLDEYQEPTGDFQIILSEVVHSPDQILHIFNAIRYDSLEISWDKGRTIHHLHSLKLRKIAKAEKAAMHRSSKFEDALKMYDNVNDKKTKNLLKSSLLTNSGAFIIPEHSITSTTAIYEQILPKDHPILKAPELVQNNLVLYYQVDKKLYPMETSFADREGAIYKYKITGLTPATAYVNIHWSIDGGKTLIPSKIMHFVTKDEFENELELINTQLPEVDDKTKKKGKPLSTPSDDSHYTGKYMTTHAISVAAQKHIQRDTEVWVPENKLEGHWNDYLIEWYGDDDIVKLESIEIDLTQEHNLISEVKNSNEWWERTIEQYLELNGDDFKKEKKKSKPKTKAEKEKAPDLNSMSKAELIELASQEYDPDSLKGYTKKDLVELLGGGK